MCFQIGSVKVWFNKAIRLYEEYLPTTWQGTRNSILQQSGFKRGITHVGTIFAAPGPAVATHHG